VYKPFWLTKKRKGILASFGSIDTNVTLAVTRFKLAVHVKDAFFSNCRKRSQLVTSRVMSWGTVPQIFCCARKNVKYIHWQHEPYPFLRAKSSLAGARISKLLRRSNFVLIVTASHQKNYQKRTFSASYSYIILIHNTFIYDLFKRVVYYSVEYVSD
jgi:hypothetical protein